LGPEEQAIGFHSGLASDWEAKYSSRASFRARERALAALLADAVERGTYRWLDAGCGTGHFSRQIASLGASVIGVDGAPEMITAARRLGAVGGGQVIYRTSADLAHLPEDDESFDGVLCSSVLEYLEEPVRVLDEFWRVTRAGGTLIVTLPNRRALVRLAQRIVYTVTGATIRRPYPEYVSHVKGFWTRAEAVTLLKAAGYEVRTVSVGGLGWGPQWLDRQVFWGPLLFVFATRRPARGTVA
jgi:2-polyprenyl-6-hydroxyphenyl methylase/3-demethylubiquinone-9 3-methyltransferase